MKILITAVDLLVLVLAALTLGIPQIGDAEEHVHGGSR
jgi:hypothetical protein